MITEATIPVVGVVLTFLFILLIILVAKMPKVGVWVIGPLVLLAPILLLRFAAGGGFAGSDAAIPLIGISVSFLFVLLVILLAKAPKVGAGLIVALVVMGVLGLLVHIPASQRRVRHMSALPYEGPPATAFVERQAQQPPIAFEQIPPTPPAISPIWSEAMDEQFEADVYPSKLTAARAAGRRMAVEINRFWDDPNGPIAVILFQEANDRDVVTEFKQAMERSIPRIRCSIETDPWEVKAGSVGVTLHIDTSLQMIDSELNNSGGKVVATASKGITVTVPFVAKLWVENFGIYASQRPQQQYIVVRSNGTCTSEGEAHQQALDDARARLIEALGRQNRRDFAGLPLPDIMMEEVLKGEFVVDRFAQSFNGSAGKIWRQALLLDVSGEKLAQLAAWKAREFRQVRMSIARMGLSAVGVVVLIAVIYFFLNMATMGYYEWSLRIAGIVLAIVAVFSVLMIVR